MSECVCALYYEGKGRLKSWTLCGGLSEGVMGQTGCAPLPPALLLTRETHM